MADLRCDLKGISLTNPTVLASGVVGTTAHVMAQVAANGAGAITSKSASLKPRTGHPNPIVVDGIASGWFLNAVGLSNPGIAEKAEEIKRYRELSKTPIIASIFASTAKEFGDAAQAISLAKPDAIELNESCPNVENEFGRPFCMNVADAANAVEHARNLTPKNILIFAKLSPETPSIEQVASACMQAGADGITAVNTAGPGMAIDIGRAKPVLANKFGGLSGPALKPLAIKCVYKIHAALPEVPIIGTGGVFTGQDAVEMMMAGASAVGIGTAVYQRGIKVFGEIAKEMAQWMDDNGYSSARQLVGKAHEK